MNGKALFHFQRIDQCQRRGKSYHEGRVRDGDRIEWKSGTAGLHLGPRKLGAAPDSAPISRDDRIHWMSLEFISDMRVLN